MGGLARQDSVARLDRRFDNTEHLLSGFDPEPLKQELVRLAWQIDSMKSDLGEVSAVPVIHAMEDKLIAIAASLEDIGHTMAHGPDFSGQFSELDRRLDEISRAIAATSRQNAQSGDNPGFARLESRINDLVTHVGSMAVNDPSVAIADRIEALTARIEEFANEDAARRLEERVTQLSNLIERNFRETSAPDVSNHLADISRKIDGLGGDHADQLIGRLEMLSQKINAIEFSPAAQTTQFSDPDAVSRLEARLADIAARLDESAAAPAADTGAMRNLEKQIATLSALISQPGRTDSFASMPDVHGGRLLAIEDYMATSDEFIVEAARQAAEAVVEAYSRQGAGFQNTGDLSALTGLAEDLRALESHTRMSDDRTRETFEALHETLVQIAGRLDEIGNQSTEEQPTYRSQPEATALEAPVRQPAVMPRAMQPDFEPANSMLQDSPPRRAPLNAKVDVLEDPHVVEKADDTADLSTVDANDDTQRAAKPVSKSLIMGLASRLLPQKKDKASKALNLQTARMPVNPAPALDGGDTLEPEHANLLLEPGSGVPDVKKILERVRAGQAQAAKGAAPVTSSGGQADVIAAARRAAQAAAAEAGIQKLTQPVKGKEKSAKPSLQVGSGNRRPILLAAAAVLLVLMSYPLVSNLIGGRASPAQADIPAPAVTIPAENKTPVSDNTKSVDTTNKVAATRDTAPASMDTAAVTPADSAKAAATVDTGAQKLMAPAVSTDQAGKLTPPADTTKTTNPALDTKSADATQSDPGKTAVTAADKQADTALPAGLQPASLAQAAKKGDPLAYFEIGARYTDGRGVKVDLTEAAKWYKLAADKGLAPAEYRLANFYEKGTGLGRDINKARDLYVSAAEKGNASAMHNLAVLYATGATGTPDFAEASRWFRDAAELNVRDSQFNLAILYARGNGVPQDLEESYKWFAIAAKGGDQDAAQKRDEVANAMPPEKLASAKAKVDLWKPKPIDDSANTPMVPDEWVAKGNTTASIDMKRAIRNIQAILNNNGFKAGTPDGTIGKQTIVAIKAFQKSVGQEPTGKIDDALVKELLKHNKKS
jgi:localization factor PodJL